MTNLLSILPAGPPPATARVDTGCVAGCGNADVGLGAPKTEGFLARLGRHLHAGRADAPGADTAALDATTGALVQADLVHGDEGTITLPPVWPLAGLVADAAVVTAGVPAEPEPASAPAGHADGEVAPDVSTPARLLPSQEPPPDADAAPVPSAAVSDAFATPGDPLTPAPAGTPPIDNLDVSGPQASDQVGSVTSRPDVVPQAMSDIDASDGDARKTSGAARTEAPQAAAAGRGRVSTPVASATGVDAAAGPEPTVAGLRDTAVRDATPRPVPGSDAVQRVLDAVEALEHAPPPRQLTVELGSVRLRVAIEDGQVRLALLGSDDDGQALLRDAEDALLARGFDLEGDRGRRQPDDGLSAPARTGRASPRARAATRTSNDVTGLRL